MENMEQNILTLGVDIGGTNTKIGAVDRNGKVLAYRKFPSRAQENFEDFLSDLQAHFERLKQELPPDVHFIGVGVGAPDVNVFSGEMEHAANFKWGNSVPLKQGIEDTLDLPTIVDNDANASAIGEMEYGTAKNMTDFVVLTLGTGLGSGIVVNSKLVYGFTGMAGEFGHTNVRPGGRRCNCGLSGCLETYVSVTGIRRTTFKMLADLKDHSPLRDVSFNDLTGNMITDAALAGDKVAREVFAYTGEILGTQLADIAAILSPEAIILAGGLTKAGNLLLLPAIESMNRHLFPVYRDKVKVVISTVDSANAAVLGASALAWNQFGEKEIEKIDY